MPNCAFRISGNAQYTRSEPDSIGANCPDRSVRSPRARYPYRRYREAGIQRGIHGRAGTQPTVRRPVRTRTLRTTPGDAWNGNMNKPHAPAPVTNGGFQPNARFPWHRFGGSNPLAQKVAPTQGAAHAAPAPAPSPQPRLTQSWSLWSCQRPTRHAPPPVA